jgi:hypothetical protein
MMNGKDCRATRREIDESELNQRLSDQTRSHVALCSSCRGFRAERTSLRELVGSLEPVPAPGDFEMRLRARMASERHERASQPFFFRLIIGLPAIGVAALIVMVALSLVWLAQRQAPRVATVPVVSVPALHAPAPPAVNNDVTARVVEDGAPANADPKPERSSRAVNAGRESNSKSNSANLSVSDYSSARAESYRQIEQRAGEVSLSAPLKPMVVSMEDDRGTTRQISLPPVSFGAQRLVDNRTNVSFTSNSRSW